MIKRSLRSYFHRHVLSGEKTVAWIQQSRNGVLDIFWRCVTVFGNEIMYLLLLPFLFWNVSTLMVYHVVLLWAFGFWIGNALKDTFRLPRPSCPPVSRLERDYEAEFGLPSTHAVNALTLPFAIVVSLHWRYFVRLVNDSYAPMHYRIEESVGTAAAAAAAAAQLDGEAYSFFASLAAVALVCALICFSRLYLGVHTPIDIYVGLGVAGALLALWFLLGMHNIVLVFVTSQSPWMPPLSVSFALGLLWLYPRPSMSNPAFVDVVGIWATMSGIMVGVYQLAWTPSAEPYYTTTSLALILGRSLLGYIILLVAKLSVKYALLRLLPHLFANRSMLLFLVKFISYFALGWFSTKGLSFVFLFAQLN
jgi:membrane-associated phospholipid phosphatase